MAENVQIPGNENEETSFVEIFFHYFQYWKWFIISIITCLLISYAYLRYSTYEYMVYSKVLIKDGQYGRGAYDLNAFSDLGLSVVTSSFDNEIEVLNSETLMKNVIDSLNLGVSYYEKGRIKDKEIYMQTPLLVSVSNQIAWGSFILNKEDENTWSIYSKDNEFSRVFSIEEEVNSPWGILRFKENPYGNHSYPVEVMIHHPQIRPYISISPANKFSSVIYVSMNTPTPQKGMDIINTLLRQYNQRTIHEKNQVAIQTINFINERLVDLTDELKTAEVNVESYKQRQGLTDIDAEARLFMSASSDYGKKISETETQMSILRSVKTFLLSPENLGSIAPANVGLTDPTILSLIKRYNDEVMDKNTSTQGMTGNNPILREYEDRIALLRDDLIKGINMSESSLQTILKELQRQESRYAGKSRSLSTQEREWGELYRQKNIKETLFIYLLQKKEETSLSLALSTPNAIIIDPANFSMVPVKPKTKIILLVALLIGLLLPFIIIYLKDLFDNKVQNKEQVIKMIKAPFLGEVPLSKSNSKFPVLKTRSRIAEKLRIITTHLNFIINKGGAKIIMITSTFSGEGKSFFSKNLAMSLASSGKKTLLIDMDMRKSMMNETLEMNPSKGVAMFLSDINIKIDEIIDRSGSYHKNLDIIPIKIFPPNPAELLLSSRLTELFNELKELDYEYVIVDTPPVGLVADAFRINEFTDAAIYVTRANYTFKSSLADIQDLHRGNQLKNLSVVLNAARETPGYGDYKDKYYVED